LNELISNSEVLLLEKKKKETTLESVAKTWGTFFFQGVERKLETRHFWFYKLGHENLPFKSKLSQEFLLFIQVK
jgi:hypothetical protein